MKDVHTESMTLKNTNSEKKSNQINVVANNIRRIIVDRGLKNKKAAELCGYSQQTFSALLTGRKLIKTEDVIAFCNGLGITPNELYIQTTDVWDFKK